MASAFCDNQWLVALILVPVACAALQLSIKIVHLEWFPDVQRRV